MEILNKLGLNITWGRPTGLGIKSSEHRLCMPGTNALRAGQEDLERGALPSAIPLLAALSTHEAV